MTPIADKDACELLDADHIAVKHLFVEYARLAMAAPQASASERRELAADDLPGADRARADRGGDLLPRAAQGRSRRGRHCWTRRKTNTSRPRT